MKKFNPIQYTRDRWADPHKTKNQPKACEDGHNFCHFEYEWAIDEGKSNCPLTQTLPTVNLPPPQEGRITVNYEGTTEENLDDWIAQSMNRTLNSLLNPQKKFFLPPNYDEELKIRYKKKMNLKQYEDETYFEVHKKAKKSVGYLDSDRKTKHNVNDLIFNYKQMKPNTLLGGTPIKKRQFTEIPRDQIRRRNAVILNNDIHYSRFLKEMAKTKDKTHEENNEKVSTKDQQIIQYGKNRREKIYSFNIESMKRQRCDEDVPNSIIQLEFERIRETPKDFINTQKVHLTNQENIHQKAREVINQKTTNALTKIEYLSKKQITPQVFIHSNVSSIQRKPTISIKTTKEVSLNGDKKLEQKVMKLLNNMQVISENIDSEMSKLNIHLSEVYFQHPTQKIQNKWVLKAEEKIKEKQNMLAIDCYKQALILQPQFFIPVYNIAVLLEKEQMLSYSKQWFQMSKQFEIDQENVSFGLSLVQIKQLKYKDGLKEIDQLITKLENSKRKVDLAYYYMRALCHKQLEQIQKAKVDYELIMKNSKPSNNSSLSYFLLSVVYAKSRRSSLSFNCLSFMKWKETLFLLFFQKIKRIKQENISVVELAEKLIKLPFFSRFSKNLIKKMLGVAQYEYIKKDTILFINSSESAIVLNGLVSVRCHEKSIKQPQTVSVLQQGGIIGGGQIDNHLSTRPNCWFITTTDIELLKINKMDFHLFWKGQITFQFDYKYNFIRNVQLFKKLSEATLFSLCELIQKRTYDKNTILFNDCSYRNELLSKEGYGFCLGKPIETDCRFIYSKKTTKTDEFMTIKRKHKTRLLSLIKKHIFKFNQLKFNRLKYPGLFILINGKVEIENDRGFRCKDIMSERDYFGENLLINSDGFHKYGRMVVESETATFYVLDIEKMAWTFTSIDKEQMIENVKNRKEIQTIRFLRNRYNECLQVKFAHLNKDKH